MKTTVFALGAAALFGVTGAADAAVVTATVNGTISHTVQQGAAFNYGFLFGADSDLEGDAFSLKFTFKLEDAGQSYSAPGEPDALYGGSDFGSAPFGQAVLTIHGVSQTVSGSSEGVVQWDAGSRSFYVGTFGQTLGVIEIAFTDPNGLFPIDLATPGVYAGLTQPGDNDGYDSSFTIAEGDGVAQGSFVAESLTISVAPEPASWALMLGGFGFVGGAMRYRRGRLTLGFSAAG